MMVMMMRRRMSMMMMITDKGIGLISHHVMS